MEINEISREMAELGKLIKSLESTAGIVNNVAHARKTGAPEELRDAYFSVTDAELRKKLIGVTTRLDQLFLQQCELKATSARADVERTIELARQPVWKMTLAAVLGAGVIGYWAIGMVGAMGASALGYLVGEWTERVSRKEYASAIEQAKHTLAEALQRLDASRVNPYLFSTAEQESSLRAN